MTDNGRQTTDQSGRTTNDVTKNQEQRTAPTFKSYNHSITNYLNIRLVVHYEH